ncbi:hypothetical protein V8J88_14010 [Massilia sp. W12]|uniref:hypothetical protein n=1 Tax=Massilia sp. W12 TaxID=3126507 RepID=UPI0030CB8FE4
MRVLAELAYSWMLFEENETLFLAVLCGGSAMFMLEFALNAAETGAYRQLGMAAIQALANQVQQDSAPFQARHLSYFGRSEAVQQAQAEWRRQAG